MYVRYSPKILFVLRMVFTWDYKCFVCPQILFVLSIGGFSCLLTVLGYGYHNLDNSDSKDYLRAHYSFRHTWNDVLDVGQT